MTTTSSRWQLTVVAGLLALASVLASDAIAAQRENAQREDSRRADQRGFGGIGITIFAEPGFQGANANFRTDVPNLLQYKMNDRVDSLRIARGEIWEVCEDKNFKGRCQVFSADEADLGRVGWGGMISSLRRVQDEDRRGGARADFGSQAPRPRLVLFDDTGFRGASFVVTDATPGLRALGNQARSAKVYGGSWELCDGDRFRGHCMTITGDVPDLRRIDLRDKVSSVRPVGRDR